MIASAVSADAFYFRELDAVAALLREQQVELERLARHIVDLDEERCGLDAEVRGLREERDLLVINYANDGVMAQHERDRAWQAFRDWCDKPTWQPIESAPRDGTRLLGLDFSPYLEAEIDIVHWESWTKSCDEEFVGEWQHDSGTRASPVCWQPLPQTPLGDA